MTRRTLVLFGLAAVASGAPGRSRPARRDFSGRWTADIENSHFGPFPKPASFTRVIEQDDLRLTIGVESSDQAGKRETGEMRFSLDGDESVNEVGGTEVVGFARRLGSHVLVHTSRETEGTKLDLDELWSLSEDGKTLMIEAAVTSSLGNEELFVVMDKQEQ